MAYASTPTVGLWRVRHRWGLALLVGLLGAVLAALPLPPTTVSAAPKDPAIEVGEFSHDSLPGDAKLAAPAVTHPAQDEVIYFLMPDRFNDGDSKNNTGGIPGGPLKNGYLPENKGYFHGGDLRGVTRRLDYLQDMGVTAIWMAPIFKNKPTSCGVGSTVDTCDAQYHGYGITDFTEVDPHFGTKADLRQLIEGAHRRSIKIYFDIVINHTADIIKYKDQPYPAPYISKKTAPYKSASGVPFDDKDYAGTNTFPALDPNVSFPHVPTFETAADAKAKSPTWLNNPIYYHNRGVSAFSGENSEYGDFFGLDDLFTEHPRVVQGMIDIHKTWIKDFGIDGYRIDTVKHVNMELWQKFSPAIQRYAASQGKSDFYMFGEVFSADPRYNSQFTTEGKLPATLDFGFQETARNFASQNGATDRLRDLFASDDYYTDADSNAYQLPTFLGNHDMGRIGTFIRGDNPDANDDELLARDKLAHALMYFSRGVPVVYYGDEQGFVGDGGDKDAREDLFASKVASYNDNDLIGTDRTTAQANFNKSHPLYQALRTYANLRKSDDALTRGTQIHRYSSDQAGIYAFSRIAKDRNRQHEFVLAFNNAKTEQTATFATEQRNGTFSPVYPASGRSLNSNAAGKVTVKVPPLSFVIYQSASRPRGNEAPGIRITAPTADQKVNGRIEIAAELDDTRPTNVTFTVKAGNGRPKVIGTDTNAPYRVYYDTSGHPENTQLTFKAIANDPSDDRRGGSVVRGDINSNTITATAVPKRDGQVTFNVTVPAGTPADKTVYMAGELNTLEPDLPGWDPGGVALTKIDATHWTITLNGSEGTLMQYRYTLGAWDFDERDASCVSPSNRSLAVAFGATPTQTVNDTVSNWRAVPPCNP